MGTEERDPGAPLSEAGPLLEAGRRRGFYQLMLVLERLLGARARVGGDLGVRDEGLRFHHEPSLACATADAVKVEVRRPTAEDPFAVPPPEVVHVTTAFFGLTGTVSPLPSYLAEEVAQEAAQADGDAPRQDLLDLFHHRLLSFFHRAGAKYDMAGQYRSDQGDDWSRRALAYLGYDQPPAPEGAPSAEALPSVSSGEPLPAWQRLHFAPLLASNQVPAWQRLRFAPLLASSQVTAAGLEAALTDVLAGHLRGGRVEVEQFVGTWVALPAADRTRLGQSAAVLGQSIVVGERLFDRTGRIRVLVGPLDRGGYSRFSAPGPVETIREVVTALAGPGLEHEVALRLAPDAVAPVRLEGAGGGGRLGRDAWLGRQGREVRVVVAG